MQYDGWRVAHYNAISNFLIYLNSVSRAYVLKGGTSLMMCYNLSRFSEDIDLDGFANNIVMIVEEFCISNGFNYRVAKNTDTVKRYMIHYGGGKPLKIEVSYRMRNIDFNAVTTIINGILVYNIQSILTMKLNAYSGRDKIRDLYDVVFIGTNYWNVLSEPLKFMLRDTLAFKGVEQYDYVIRDQADELINNEELAVGFLTLWKNLGLN